MSKKSFVNAALILMIAGLIVRVMGFAYRIYLSNMIGAEGMGLFQLISPVYSLIILTLTSGISIAVSKMTAEQNALGNHVSIMKIVRISLCIVVFAGIVVSLFLLVFISFIVNNVINDSRTYYSFLLMIPCIPIISASSTLKGYFYGLQEAVPSAVSQVFEQTTKIFIVFLLAPFFIQVGLEYACALATLAMAVGEIISLIVLYVFYIIKKKRHSRKVRGTGAAGSAMSRVRILFNIVKISVPISVNRFITSIMSAVEAVLIPSRLLLTGLDYKTCIEEFGRLSGMAMPLIFFPSIITSSLATTLVPAISESVSVKNMRSVRNKISKSIQISFIIGIIFAAVFYVLPEEISNLIYKGQNVGPILAGISLVCIFLFVQQTMLGVLNGLGLQSISLRNSVIGYTIRLIFVIFIIPVKGMPGYIQGLLISTAIVCVLDMIPVIKRAGMILDIRNWILKPVVPGIFILVAGKPIYVLLHSILKSNFLTIGFSVSIMIVISCLLLILMGALDIRDLKKKKGAV